MISNTKKGLVPKNISAKAIIKKILAGDRVSLSRAITLIESSLYKDQILAQEIIEKCLPFSGKSIRIGISGIPGVGKSTFIEALGMYLTAKDKKIAVLAIDPSSERSKGSILGDKTRMEELATEKNAFIRPSPSNGSLGGVTKKTRESIILCEAAGFNTILIETVGVGQSETAAHSMVDCFLLLMIAGAGDELQGIKRGIMEMADLVVINKADGSNINQAKLAQGQYQNSLHLFPANESKWRSPVLTCSSITKSGIPEVWETITEYIDIINKNGYFTKRRQAQTKYWMYENINQSLLDRFYNDTEISKKIISIEKAVIDEKMNPFHAANILINEYFNK